MTRKVSHRICWLWILGEAKMSPVCPSESTGDREEILETDTEIIWGTQDTGKTFFDGQRNHGFVRLLFSLRMPMTTGSEQIAVEAGILFFLLWEGLRGRESREKGISFDVYLDGMAIIALASRRSPKTFATEYYFSCRRHACPEAQRPRGPDAQRPRDAETQRPRGPDPGPEAQRPRGPETQRPRDAETAQRPRGPEIQRSRDPEVQRPRGPES